jgi:hypothetical protein
VGHPVLMIVAQHADAWLPNAAHVSCLIGLMRAAGTAIPGERTKTIGIERLIGLAPKVDAVGDRFIIARHYDIG